MLIDTKLLHFYVYALLVKDAVDELRKVFPDEFLQGKGMDLARADSVAEAINKFMATDDSLAYVIRLAVSGADCQEQGGELVRHPSAELAKTWSMFRVEKLSHSRVAKKLQSDKEAVRKASKRYEKYLEKLTARVKEIAAAIDGYPRLFRSLKGKAKLPRTK